MERRNNIGWYKKYGTNDIIDKYFLFQEEKYMNFDFLNLMVKWRSSLYIE